MKNIAIIGAGQLGSRHLQALAKVKENITLYIVDPSEQSLKTSQDRFYEVNDLNKKLICTQSINALPKEIEFVVISTNSKQRLGVLKELIAHARVKYLLLEKFLFPLIDEYEEASTILQSVSTKVYVNCTRRMWTSYQHLKLQLDNKEQITFNVSGVNWNLASNSIHFLDVFLYLVDENYADIDHSSLDNEIVENKRPGYIEFTGTLKAVTPKGHQLILTSDISGVEPINITVTSNNKHYKIYETEQRMLENDEEKAFEIYHQSNLTNKVYEQLQQRGSCSLVDYAASANEHLLLLNAFNSFLGARAREGAIT